MSLPTTEINEVSVLSIVRAKRTGIVLCPDPKRVLFRPFVPGDNTRVMKILARIMALSEADAQAQLDEVFAEFGSRHVEVDEFFIKRYQDVRRQLLTDTPLSEERKLLIGAYFTHEYSLEASALFNPSMVWHPDQSGLAEGQRRFILSLRATGEGHISSITFRSGTIDAQNAIHIDPVSRFVTPPDAYPNTTYEKWLIELKMSELNMLNEAAGRMLGELPDFFTLPELEARVRLVQQQWHTPGANAAGQAMLDLARSNYELTYEPTNRLSERIIFPFTPNETNGIEDARFVKFTDDDATTYYATYTAYNGRVILPQLLETSDFLHFTVKTLNGAEVQNKGMALFPRKIGGRYAMLSRQDNENIFLMFSDNIHFWQTKEVILKPAYSWEMIQLGNCGSPIETEAGWLVLSHGVGPMRKYSIGAFLLDLHNPTKVIGRLREPLLSPNENEREGYVPNVVYSCGGVINDSQLIIPYAMSDSSSSFATIGLEELLSALTGPEGQV
ncbi:MAG: glycoside hydrolase family 130 protein [Cytophagaceae bacterium]|nr:glycoside hydrolase family 130 protein [Cytophagaceae bacterium]